MNQDLTTGNPQKALWAFCLPMFGSILFQQLYNIADSLIAGRFIGENALAAVGNSYNITLIFIAFAFGCNMGCSVIVSQLFGAKDYVTMKSSVYTALSASAVLCAALMAFGLLSCDTACLFYFSTILQPEFLPRSEIPEPRFCFWHFPLPQILQPISCLSKRSAWESQERPGQHFSARASAACAQCFSF